MKTLSTLLLFVSIVFQSFQISAQVPPIAISNVSVAPSNPSTNDNITVSFDFYTPNITQYMSKSYTVNGNTINIKACYRFTPMLTPTTHNESISIGNLQQGNYTIEVKAYTSISNVSCDHYDSTSTNIPLTVTSITSLHEKSLLKKLDVYPNPAQDNLTIEAIKGLEIKEVNIQDIQGKVIQFSENKRENHSEKIEINIEEVPAGIYFLTLYTTKGKSIQKLIVQ